MKRRPSIRIIGMAGAASLLLCCLLAVAADDDFTIRNSNTVEA